MQCRTLILMSVALLACLGTLAAACNGAGDSLTLDEYFVRFEEIDAEVDRQIATLYASLPSGSEEEFFSNEDNLPLVRDLMNDLSSGIAVAIDDLAGLDPPSEVADTHDELVDAGRGFATAIADAAEDIASAVTIAEVAAPLAAISPAYEDLSSACRGLVAVSTANGLAVEASCAAE